MRLILTIAVLVGMLCHSVAHAAGERIAVLELRGAVDATALRLMTDEVRGGVLDAVRGGDFIVMTRENMALIAKDMGKDLSCLEGECEVETGRNIGAAYVVSGEVVSVGGRLNLVLKLHETDQGALRSKRRAKAQGIDALVDAASALGRAVTQEGLSLSPTAGAASAGPVQASGSVSFGGGLQMDVQGKLREKRCSEAAETKGKAQRKAKLDDAARNIQAQAMTAWRAMRDELEDCTQLDYADRGQCRTAVNQWLQGARTAQVSLPDGEETVQTDCGQRVAVFAAEKRAVSISTQTAQSMLTRLNTRSKPKATVRSRADVPPTLSGSSTRVLKLSDVGTETKSDFYRQKARQKRGGSRTMLEDLLRKNKARGETKAVMLLRLAGNYMEEGEDLYRTEMGKFQDEFDACFNNPNCNTATMKPDNSGSKRWRLKAIKIYQAILKGFPQFLRADEALFYLAIALQETGKPDAAAKRLAQLIQDYPQSRNTPVAYVLIGEYYFENNNAYKALAAYQEAAKYTSSPKYGFAQYKLAWCYYNLGEYGKAIATMRSVVAYTMSADKEGQMTLQEAALKDLTRFFADAGEMDEAYVYFNKLGKRGLIVKMLERLATTYYEQGKFRQARSVCIRLKAEAGLPSTIPACQE